MLTKEYDVEVVTPMFLAGADQNQAEIRAASIKGQLRWWWRALNNNLSQRDLKKAEEKIFGSTSNKSRFSIIIKNESVTASQENLPSGKKISVSSRGRTFSISVIDYLAYGIVEYQRGRGNVYTRPYITPESTFTLQITYYDDAIKENLEMALNYWASYGGLGAKNRNGFGSILLKNNLPKLQLAYQNDLGHYTSISKDSRLFVFNKHKSWEDALSEIGRIYREARLNLEPRHLFDRRKLVARPIIVKKEINIPDRHAKPIFLHVDKIDSQFQGKILVLPYLYKEPHNRTQFEKVMEDMFSFFIKSGAKR